MEWMSMRGVCAPVMGSAAGKEVAAGSTACCREGGTGQRGGSVLSWEETPVSDTPVLFFIPPVGNHVIVKDCSFLLTQ